MHSAWRKGGGGLAVKLEGSISAVTGILLAQLWK